MTTKEKRDRQLQCSGYLKESVKQADTLYCVLIHQSDSGTSRIKVLVVTGSGDKAGIRNESWNIAHALGYRFNSNDNTVVVPGYGYSKPQHIAESLSYELFGEGDKLGYTWV